MKIAFGSDSNLQLVLVISYLNDHKDQRSPGVLPAIPGILLSKMINCQSLVSFLAWHGKGFATLVAEPSRLIILYPEKRLELKPTL